MENEEIINFNKNSEYKIDDVIYKVTSYFDDNSEDLYHKIKRLLTNEINSACECGF